VLATKEYYEKKNMKNAPGEKYNMSRFVKVGGVAQRWLVGGASPQ
jgi:hypothetical protein